MTGVDGTTQDVQRLAAARRRMPRSRSRFEVWAWSPIIILRIALVTEYLAGVYFGISSFFGGVPVFIVAAPDWWTPIFAIGIAASSGVCAFAAISDHLHGVEVWADGVLVVLMSSYVGSLTIVGYAVGDPSRQAVAAATFMAFVLPACRLVWLLAQIGKKKTKAG